MAITCRDHGGRESRQRAFRVPAPPIKVPHFHRRRCRVALTKDCPRGILLSAEPVEPPTDLRREKGGLNWAHFSLIKFVNISVSGHVREVRSSVFGPNEMFKYAQSFIL